MWSWCISPSCARRKSRTAPASELSLIAFPDRRTLRAQDQRFRPHHLRPLFEPDAAAAASISTISSPMSKTAGLFWRRSGRISRRCAGSITRRSESILPARPDGALFEQAFRAHVSKDGEKHPVTRGLAGSKTTPPSWGEWFRQVNTQCAEGRQRAARRRGQAVAGALARGQGARRHAADRSDVAVGARLTRAAGRMSI